jgi:1-acyl-sn-glycerol-3-phosphate acyltransferase
MHPIFKGVRTVFRGVHLAAVLATATVDSWLQSRSATVEQRAAYAQRWSRNLLRAVRVEVDAQGPLAPAGWLVANHLSYLDILVLASVQPFIFVAKSEVAQWPIFGRMSRSAGTAFIERRRRTDVARVLEELRTLVASGIPIVVFPEGTSSDGSQVLPFHPGLLEGPAAEGWPVTPAGIAYSVEGGNAAEHVCYWGDMTLLPHLGKLLTLDRVVAHLRTGPPLTGIKDRKVLAAAAHAAVRELKGDQKPAS